MIDVCTMEPEAIQSIIGDVGIGAVLIWGYGKVSKQHSDERKGRDESWQKAIDETVKTIEKALETLEKAMENVATAIVKMMDEHKETYARLAEQQRIQDLRSAEVHGMIIAKIGGKSPDEARKLAQAAFDAPPDASR